MQSFIANILSHFRKNVNRCSVFCRSQGSRDAVIGMSRSIAIEVANMIVFLASKEASYITGQTFIVDSGNTIQEYKGPSELYY